MSAPIPLGPGLIACRIRLRKPDVYVLGGILAGEDHLASIHGEADDGALAVVTLVTTIERAAELDGWLEALASELAFERLPPP